MSRAPIPLLVPMPKDVPAEMTRFKEETTAKGKSVYRRVIIRRFVIKKGTTLFQLETGIPGLKKGAWLADPRNLTKDGKLRFDVNASESINPETGESERSYELSLNMANSFMEQTIKVAALIGGFVFNKQHILVMLLTAMIGGITFLALDPILHIAPSIQVHWVPSPPRFG